MTRTTLFTAIAAAAGIALLAGPAGATNGYFAHGYGTAAKGMAGAGVALHADAAAPATNPAALAFAGRRSDVGIAWFRPDRTYTVEGAPSGHPGTFGLAPGTFRSAERAFLVPSFATTLPLSGGQAVGVAVYGNGGMNTTWRTQTFGAGATGVDLSQLFVAPTYARAFAGGHHAVGVTAIAGAQRFKATGLGAFAAFSETPECLSDVGYAMSYGAGLRVGYRGALHPMLSLGAAYQSPTWMSKFDDYCGLFAGQGDFDVPPNWTAGVALHPHRAVDVAVDVQRVLYSQVDAVGAPLLPNLVQAPLGGVDAAGFGWRDMTVWKVGTQLRTDPRTTLRAGVSHGRQPVPESEVLFNILAPGIMETHVTAGFTRQVGANQAVNVAVMRALESTVRGPNPLEAPGRQTIELGMSQWEVELGWSFGF